MKKVLIASIISSIFLGGCSFSVSYERTPRPHASITQKMESPERGHFVALVRLIQANFRSQSTELKQQVNLHVTQSGMTPVCDKGDCFLLYNNLKIVINQDHVFIRFGKETRTFYDVEDAAEFIYGHVA